MSTQGIDIEFPANPFVVLADFLIMLLLVVVLAVVHQSLGTNKVIERTAVSVLQDQLNGRLWSADNRVCKSGMLRAFHERGQLVETYRDGDLQRFWFGYPVVFARGSGKLETQQGQRLLQEFGRVLASSQGNPRYPETRPFKRIIVEGHADRSEGSNEATWAISLARANQATLLLCKGTRLSPELVEASGRGCWVPVRRIAGNSGRSLAEANRRIEIIVVYAGRQSVDHINRRKRQ